MLGFNRRFDPNHAALQDEVRRGEVGKLEIIQMTSRGPSLPAISYLATSGGQLKDQTIHFFDLLRWITGDEAEEVYALGAAMVDPQSGRSWGCRHEHRGNSDGIRSALPDRLRQTHRLRIR